MWDWYSVTCGEIGDPCLVILVDQGLSNSLYIYERPWVDRLPIDMTKYLLKSDKQNKNRSLTQTNTFLIKKRNKTEMETVSLV